MSRAKTAERRGVHALRWLTGGFAAGNVCWPGRRQPALADAAF
jgi:hypothetical protein